MKIHADMLITDILAVDPHMANILMQRGMHCISCIAAAGETLREAGFVHGMDDAAMQDLVDQLNDFLGQSGEG